MLLLTDPFVGSLSDLFFWDRVPHWIWSWPVSLAPGILSSLPSERWDYRCVSMLLCPLICTHIFIHTAFLNAKKHEKVFAHFLLPSLFNLNLRSVFLLLSISSNQECIKHNHLRDVLVSSHLKYNMFCADVMVPVPNPSSGRSRQEGQAFHVVLGYIRECKATLDPVS